MNKFLLWDHDGVLVDTERLYFAATKEILDEMGVELDQATYLRLMARGLPSWDLARNRGVTEPTISEAKRRRDRRYQELLATEPIEIDGVLEVLAELSSHYRMAIVSTSRREDFDLIHRYRRIRDFFEFVINIEDCSKAKPDPDPYLRGLDRFRATPAETLAIEDSSRGLAAAIAAGLDCAVIRNSFTATQDFSGAWRLLDSIRDLPQALASRSHTR